ncbi:hypothetical protein D3C73_887090 [compost metagenome]
MADAAHDSPTIPIAEVECCDLSAGGADTCNSGRTEERHLLQLAPIRPLHGTECQPVGRDTGLHLKLKNIRHRLRAIDIKFGSSRHLGEIERAGNIVQLDLAVIHQARAECVFWNFVGNTCPPTPAIAFQIETADAGEWKSGRKRLNQTFLEAIYLLIEPAANQAKLARPHVKSVGTGRSIVAAFNLGLDILVCTGPIAAWIFVRTPWLRIIEHAVCRVSDTGLYPNAGRPIIFAAICRCREAGQIATTRCSASRVKRGRISVTDILQLAVRHDEGRRRLCRKSGRIEQEIDVVTAALKPPSERWRLQHTDRRRSQNSA